MEGACFRQQSLMQARTPGSSISSFWTTLSINAVSQHCEVRKSTPVFEISAASMSPHTMRSPSCSSGCSSHTRLFAREHNHCVRECVRITAAGGVIFLHVSVPGCFCEAGQQLMPNHLGKAKRNPGVDWEPADARPEHCKLHARPPAKLACTGFRALAECASAQGGAHGTALVALLEERHERGERRGPVGEVTCGVPARGGHLLGFAPQHRLGVKAGLLLP
eukprot:scaffold624_cov402-Prasinococcus_capsulatus_cf.AAC.74